MTQPTSFRRPPLPALALALMLPLAVWAHEGHDDAAERTPAAAAAAPGPSGAPTAAHAPRFAAASDTFELVGTLDGARLTLWLDWSASNAPVDGASIELEVGDARVRAHPAGEAYVAELPAVPAAAMLPVTAVVTAGRASDLLATDIALAPTAAPAPAADPPATAGRPAPRWSIAATALGSTLAGGFVGWTLKRKRRQPVGAR